MFESDFLERFSRIHPATPFVVWIPVAAVFVVRSVLRHDLAPLAIPAPVPAGHVRVDVRGVRAPPVRLSLDE